MRLTRFRVTGFRSVRDSGWVETDAVTALIGTNESGKTNLLLPLWKLNPAKEGAIDLLADAPRERYNEIRAAATKPVFIWAEFELTPALAAEVATLARSLPDAVRRVEVSRDFAGRRTVHFPDAAGARGTPAGAVTDALRVARAEIDRLGVPKAEEALKAAMLANIADAEASLVEATDDGADGPTIGMAGMVGMEVILARDVDLDKAPKRSAVVPHYTTLLAALEPLIQDVTAPAPDDAADAVALVLERMPTFVYYSNYGNLDSEIYLPHVIENMNRAGLGAKETAKARTLRVLFEFVGLSPEEILELGRDFQPASPSRRDPTDDEIAAVAAKKKERSVLLQSAGAQLTKSFREWWRQGEYRFQFEADGDHFRIWVSDDRRPENIELEGRSTGLQWFLSFYLTFLVERGDAHRNAILLLDEPGHSLHPLAQRDLSEFFANLAETNQLLYTTHSPFLVDPDHLDRVKAVYVQDDGTTGVSPNLRASEGKAAQSRSIYPVHAAVGLTVSDTLLQGCQPVIVEGPSDLHYLSAIKNLLIAAGRITPTRELVFVPAGGVRGVAAVVAIMTGAQDALLFALLDGDAPGLKLAQQLRGGVYQGAADRVLVVDAFVGGMAGAEIEDLIPTADLAAEVRRLIRGREDDFDQVAREGEPIVAQIEAFAAAEQVALGVGWKVDLAKRVKARLLRQGVGVVAGPVLERWHALFATLVA